MNRGVLLAIVALCSACPVASERSAMPFPGTAEHGAIVWSGFEHDWVYNHRINSHGDWVGPVTCDDDGCDAEVGHSAASGSGSDVATWRSRGTRVYSPDAWFFQGETEFVFVGATAEGQTLRQTLEAEVELPSELHGLGAYTVVLGGLDIFSTEDPDKLADLDVGVGPIDVDDGVARFDVNTALRVDCDSLECDGVDKLNASLSYIFRVAWLVVGAAEDGLVVTEVDESNAYTWLPAPEPELTTDETERTQSVAIDPAAGTPIPAFRGFTLEMGFDHHMVEWASTVAVESAGATADVTSNIRFMQWNRSTLDFVLSYTDAGTAKTEARMALLQLPGAWTEAGEVDGEITWTADGGPADSDLAVEIVDAGFVPGL